MKQRFRVFVERAGQILQVVTVAWSQADASLYLSPAGTTKPTEGFVGLAPDLPVNGSIEFDYTTQGHGRSPYLSLHASGQTHARAGEYRTDPMVGPPLATAKGEHVASVALHTTEGLPSLDRAPRGGHEPDVILRDDNGVLPELGGLVVAIFAGSTAASIKDHRLRLAMHRGGGLADLHVGFAARANTGAGTPGVTVIGGWGPGPT